MSEPAVHVLRATPETVHWGYFERSHKPVLRVQSGDIVLVETLAHHAGDAPDLMMDEGVRAVYDAIPGPDRAPGVHIVTGPIYVDGAQPGDTLECRVLRLEPRPGALYGSNFLANWGLLYKDFKLKEHVVIWKADVARGTVQAVFQYAFPGKLEIPGTITRPGAVARLPALSHVAVPLGFHIGTAAVAPDEDGRVTTIPPGHFGGNMDNRSFGPGTSMYYPVLNPGALFWCGDAHLAQGDGEISGTAIEAHVNATLQLIVRKDLQVHNPVLETATEWMCHAFHEDLNESMRLAALEAIEFLTKNQGLSREEAYSLLSVAGDFRITQVVDGKKGIHAVLRKDWFRVPATWPQAR